MAPPSPKQARAAGLTRPDLSDRGLEVLRAVVRDYIDSAEPVGSKHLVEGVGLSASPATIRAVMADLEQLGYLAKPHASAGRVPTPKAFRFYVDTFLEAEPLPDAAKVAVRRAYQPPRGSVDELMAQTGRILSRLTHHAAVVAAPLLSRAVYRQIRFVKLREDRVLAILVSESGMVQNRVLVLEEEMSQEELDRATTLLDEHFGALTLTEVRVRLREALARDEAARDALERRAMELAEAAVDGTEERADEDLIVSGQEALLAAPEFATREKLQEVLELIARREQLLRVLEQAEGSQGIQIYIGTESEFGGEDLSLVVTTYQRGGQVLGALGVIGPTRMDYGRVVASVRYTAAHLSRAFDA
ncbi:MAG: heat-inducible transcriptional repressor HrcA [Deltaproteobacteria bacterium]|nr:heat-inducible transcriptional repressor HrcA [Deltaproteobacteria bacterium]